MIYNLNDQINENTTIKKSLLKLEKNVNKIIEIIYSKIRSKGKLLICGNGGSAADAQHLVAEFVVRLRPHIDRNPIPALSLVGDTSTITACGNDYNFDQIFQKLNKKYFIKIGRIILLYNKNNDEIIKNENLLRYS